MSSIELDVVNAQKSEQDAQRLGLNFTLLKMDGPGGGNPLVQFEGPIENIEALLKEHATDAEDYAFLHTHIQ